MYCIHVKIQIQIHLCIFIHVEGVKFCASATVRVLALELWVPATAAETNFNFMDSLSHNITLPAPKHCTNMMRMMSIFFQQLELVNSNGFTDIVLHDNIDHVKRNHQTVLFANCPSCITDRDFQWWWLSPKKLWESGKVARHSSQILCEFVFFCHVSNHAVCLCVFSLFLNKLLEAACF